MDFLKMDEINTPDVSGTDEPHAEADFDNALDGILDDPQADTIDPGEGEQDVEAQAPNDGAQSDAVEGQEATEETPNADPVKYVLPDGTEATADEVTEWKKGYLRQSDYTRKTQEAAAQRQEIERQQTEYQQQAQRVEQELDLAIRVAQQYLPPEPNEQLLYTGNPNDAAEYQRQRLIYDQRASELQQLVSANSQYKTQAQQREQQEQVELIKREQEALYEAHPDLRDEATRQAFRAQASDTIQHYGFTQQELDNVYDHRLIGMLKDLSEYRKLKAAKPAVQKKAENAPPVKNPGRRISASEQNGQSIADSIGKLRSTGSPKDFEDFLDHIL